MSQTKSTQTDSTTINAQTRGTVQLTLTVLSIKDYILTITEIMLLTIEQKHSTILISFQADKI